MTLQKLEQNLADPLWPDVFLAAAELEAQSGNASAARAHLQRLAEHGHLTAASTAARDRALWQFQLGRVLQTLQDMAGANTAFLEAVNGFGGDTVCQHPICAQIQVHLAELAVARGDRQDAQARLRRALPILEANMAPQSRKLLRARALSETE